MRSFVKSLFLSHILLLFLYSCSPSLNSKSLVNNQSSSSTAAATAASSDPLYIYQWHLKNSGQLTDLLIGEDINVTSVWDSGNKGDDVVIAIVDDGLEINHPDLIDNVYGNYNWNYLAGGYDPSPIYSDDGHGTSVGGLMAARDENGIGVKGVAPRAKIVGYNLLADSGAITSNEADAMIRNENIISISNNSWGATDETGKLSDASSAWMNAINEGITNGRNGKGIVYVWAAGNGADDDTELDRSDYDGQANYYGVMSICATNDQGEKAYYSESGSNLWVCAPSNGGVNGLTTTDLMEENGYNNSGSLNELSDTNYTKTFGGTSGATPIVSGVVALMLKKDSNLSWRDVKLILAQTARKIQSSDSGWVTNGGGYNVHYKYGFGVVDASAAVNAISSWTKVGTFKTYTKSSSSNLNLSIPDIDATGVSNSITVESSASKINKIEFIEVTVDIKHAYWGDLNIELSNSNSPITSIFLKAHVCNDGDDPPLEESCKNSQLAGSVTTFRFGSARHLGESSNGTWSIKVFDSVYSDTGRTGTLNNWRITFYGRE